MAANTPAMSLPGPSKYVRYWPSGLCLEVMGHDFTHFWGPVRPLGPSFGLVGTAFGQFGASLGPFKPPYGQVGPSPELRLVPAWAGGAVQNLQAGSHPDVSRGQNSL